MGFKEMDPNKIRELLANEQDIIAPAAQLDAQRYEICMCPVCSHVGADKVYMPPKVVPDSNGAPQIVRSSFSSNRILPQGYAKCKNCGTIYHPDSRIIAKQGVIDDQE